MTILTVSPLLAITRRWYESGLPWIRYGQEAEFTAESFPGELFKGRTAFIDPVLNQKARTLNVRLNVANAVARWAFELVDLIQHGVGHFQTRGADIERAKHDAASCTRR